MVRVINNRLELSDDFIQRVNKGYSAALLRGHNLDNEDEIVEKLKPVSVAEFFETLRGQVREYYK